MGIKHGILKLQMARYIYLRWVLDSGAKNKYTRNICMYIPTSYHLGGGRSADGPMDEPARLANYGL